MQYVLNKDGSVSELNKKKKEKKSNLNISSAFSTKPLEESVKNFSDTFKNSAVKNQGLNFSNVVTDMANIDEAGKNVLKSIPILGEKYKLQDAINKNITNVATNMGTGAIKTIEGAADTASDLVFNPLERAQNYAYDYITKGKKVADENLKDLKKMQQRDIKKNMTEDFLNTTGYNDIADELEKGSLVKRENIGGQVSQGLGGMVPSLVLGQAFGGTPQLTDTANLVGKEKLAAMAGNVGKTYMSQLPANAMLTASAYGGGVEEALNEGANMNQARLYGLSNAAIEQGTEMLTGGLPGLQGRGGIDQFVDPALNRVNNKYLAALLKAGYGAAGEGLEEYTSEMLNPLAKKIYSDDPINWDETREKARQAALTGSITGAFLNAPNTVNDFREARTGNIQNNIQTDEDISEVNPERYITLEQQNKANTGENTQSNINTQGMQENANMSDIQVPSEANQNIDENTQQDNIKLSNLNGDTIRATIAPYYDTPLTKENYNEITSKVDSSFKQTAENITSLFGGKIKDVSNNIGGFTFEEGQNAGQWVNELSYTFELENMSNDDAILMSSLMGDLAHEQQEAVISASYQDLQNSNALEYRLQYKNLDNLMKTLDKLGIHDYTIDKSNNTLKLLEFDLDNPVETAKKIADIYQELGDEVENAEYSGIKSDYITKGDRERIYKTWLESNQGSQTSRELRSLVEQAYEKVRSEDGGTSDSSFNLAEERQEPVIKSQEYKDAIKKVKEGTATEKERSYIQTAVESQNTQEIVKDMEDVAKNYEPLANEKTLRQAENKIKNLKTLEQQANYVNDLLKSDKRLNASDMAAAELVLKNAAASKNAKIYNDVLANLSIYATEQGQSIQALSLIKKLSPTSQLDVLEKIIQREQAKGNKAYDGLEITEEMKNKVLDCYDENGKVNKEQFDNTMEEIKQELADSMKTTADEKVRAWRYLSMLGNPKTHVRNIVANVAMNEVKLIKDKISAATQDIFIRDKSKKTGTLKIASSEVKNFANDMYNEIANETVGNKYNEKSDLENRKRIFKTQALENVRKFNDTALSKEDQFFKKMNFKRSFANYLTAQGISTKADIEANPQIVERAKQFAIQEANVATFNQQNKLSEFINSADNKLGKPGRVIRGAIIPFTRTPLNIAKTGIEYTPGLGLATTIADVKKAPANMKANVLIDGLSKQITGSSLALLGYALAKSGIVTSSSDEDKEGKFKSDQGSTMNYSIKIGDKSYDLSWLAPSSMPFFVGARMFEVLDKQEGINENIILESIASTLDPLSEMSCISSFTDVLQSYSKEGGKAIKDMAISTGQNYLSQFIPTVAGQFARVFDDKKRTTAADSSSPNKITQETYRQLAYKIPGLRNTLPESTDFLGKTKKEDENAVVRAFNALINPMNERKDTMTKEGKEILRLYNKTGNDSIIPAALSQKVTFNDKDYQMTRKEYNSYKKDFGKSFEENLKKLMNTSDYKNASDGEKATMIEGIMNYSKDKTKDNFLTSKGEDYEKINKSGEKSPYISDKVDSLTNKDFTIADYYIYKTYAPNVVNGTESAAKNRINVINTFGIDYKIYSEYMEKIGDIKGDTDKNGKTIPNSRKKKVFNYINGLNLTAEQKKLLMKKTYSSYKSSDKELFNTINNSNLTLEEKESLKNFLKIGK